MLTSIFRSLSDAVYGRIPGAQYVNRSDVGGAVWEVPCDREVNMTFIFGGQRIPIHPLDTTLDLKVTNDAGDKVCIGSVSSYRSSFRPTAAHCYVVSTHLHCVR